MAGLIKRLLRFPNIVNYQAKTNFIIGHVLIMKEAYFCI